MISLTVIFANARSTSAGL